MKIFHIIPQAESPVDMPANYQKNQLYHNKKMQSIKNQILTENSKHKAQLQTQRFETMTAQAAIILLIRNYHSQINRLKLNYLLKV